MTEQRCALQVFVWTTAFGGSPKRDSIKFCTTVVTVRPFRSYESKRVKNQATVDGVRHNYAQTSQQWPGDSGGHVRNSGFLAGLEVGTGKWESSLGGFAA